MTTTPLNIYYEGLKREGIIFSFTGPISQVILESIGEALRRKLKFEMTQLPTIHRVFSVFIEQAQNIMHYSAEIVAPDNGLEEKIKAGILILGHEDGHYYVCCGNYIKSEKARQLKADLSRINGLEKRRLRALYKERQKAEPSPEGAGAGLGFIEIARRATRPIEFEVNPIDNGVSFFSIKAVV